MIKLIQQISTFLAKAHPDGCKSRARLSSE